MRALGVVPALLEGNGAFSLAALPGFVARQLIKQVQWLLSAPNQQLGKPFLQGNFAPQLNEMFTQNLPVVTQSGITHTGGPINTHAATSNGRTNGRAAAKATMAALSGEVNETSGAANDVKQQKDTANGYLNSHTNGHANGHTFGGSHVSSSVGPVNGSSHELVGQGQLPEGLSGVFMRIGPNPLLEPLGGYHWFDGDGMVHAVRINGGTASYCNRWVPTSRLTQEAAAGWPLFIKLGDYVGLRGLGLIYLERLKIALGLVDKTAGAGTANTAMVCHAARLLALNEGDLPYALRIMCDGLIEAVGRVAVSGPVGRSFTAHPKVDPVTGELHFFRYTFESAPYVSYGVLGPKGDLIKSLPISAANLPRPVMMHDFAITERWVLFLDNPLCFDGERMVKEHNLPFTFKADQGSRVGLLPRSADNESGMLWFRLPAHMVFHVVNAWEENDGTVKLFVCYQETINLNLDTRSTAGIPPEEQPRLAVITLDPSSPQQQGASLRAMTSTPGDFPQINPRFVGRKQRYAYVATMVTGVGAAVKWDGVAKMDLWAAEGEDALVAKVQLPPGCHNGETVFAPRFEDPELCSSEDDGYLLTYVHDESAGGSGGSSLVVWDAKTMAQQPLAVVQLPHRVPYGFHALWVPESQFQQQLKGHPLQPTSAV